MNYIIPKPIRNVIPVQIDREHDTAVMSVIITVMMGISFTEPVVSGFWAIMTAVAGGSGAICIGALGLIYRADGSIDGIDGVVVDIVMLGSTLATMILSVAIIVTRFF